MEKSRSSNTSNASTSKIKRGSWTPQEDKKLFDFIQLYGHGSWRSLPEKAGLQRCGKSCRLRWKNYLNPYIKRGNFTFQEDQTIIQLHALLGNRWSAIAANLPRRTDNEIKNYWNSHLKNRLAKKGFDPETHKPKINILGSSNGDPKTLSNLSHVAQWESARLEAEARFARESKLVKAPPTKNFEYFGLKTWETLMMSNPNGTLFEAPSLIMPSAPEYFTDVTNESGLREHGDILDGMLFQQDYSSGGFDLGDAYNWGLG